MRPPERRLRFRDGFDAPTGRQHQRRRASGCPLRAAASRLDSLLSLVNPGGLRPTFRGWARALGLCGRVAVRRGGRPLDKVRLVLHRALAGALELTLEWPRSTDWAE
jgi:hypothetical protein